MDNPDGDKELALMNVPKENVIPTFLAMATKETEPFEPKSLSQAKKKKRRKLDGLGKSHA